MDFIKELQELKTKYPNLPVYISVEPDTVEDNQVSSKYLGLPGKVAVKDYLCNDDTGELIFKEDVDNDTLFEKVGDIEPDKVCWERAIFLNAGV